MEGGFIVEATKTVFTSTVVKHSVEENHSIKINHSVEENHSNEEENQSKKITFKESGIFKKLKKWWKKLTTAQQVHLVGVFGNALIHAMAIIISALIAKSIIINFFPPVNEQTKPPEIDQPENIRSPEVENIINICIKHLKQINEQKNYDEKQRLLGIVFDLLNKALDKEPNDPKTHFLLAEAYFLNNDFYTSFYHLDKANGQYKFTGDISYLYSNLYEKLGDQYSLNNQISNSNVNYNLSIGCLYMAIYEQCLSFHNINEIIESLSQVERKIENNNNVNVFFAKYSLDIRNSSNIDYLYELEKLARNLSELGLYKQSVMLYYILLQQQTTINRRNRIYKDFIYTSVRWEFSHDGEFLHCISDGSVKGIVNDNDINFRKDKSLTSKVIRMLKKDEEVKVLERSDFKQYIEREKTNVYWYKIRTDDGEEGWVYGKFLTFFPIP